MADADYAYQPPSQPNAYGPNVVLRSLTDPQRDAERAARVDLDDMAIARGQMDALDDMAQARANKRGPRPIAESGGRT